MLAFHIEHSTECGVTLPRAYVGIHILFNVMNNADHERWLLERGWEDARSRRTILSAFLACETPVLCASHHSRWTS